MPSLPDARTLTRIERLLYGIAVVLLGGWGAVTLDAQLYNYSQERRLARLIEDRQAAAATVMPPPPAVRASILPAAPASAPSKAPEASPADLVGRIEVPRLNLRAIIAEGIDAPTLRRAVGHLPGTPLPGESGNVVLAGHRDTFFRALRNVRAEDIIRITTPRGRFEYVVEATAVVESTRTDILEDTAAPSVTLVTCYPFYLVGEAPDRFIVRARLLGADTSD